MRRPQPIRQIYALRGFRSRWLGCGAVVLACFSLLAQALLPPPAGATTRSAEPGAPNWVLASLCLAHGAAAPSPEDQPAGQDPGKAAALCSVCLGLHLVDAYVPPTQVAMLPPESASRILMAGWTIVDHGDAYRTASRARAPPTTA